MGCWCDTKIIAIHEQEAGKPGYVELRFIEGDNEGLEWSETFEYLNLPCYYRERGDDPAPPGMWTDPAGGVHYDDDDDPARHYE